MTTSNVKTADEYRAMAQDSRRQSRESFDRCDTDGALSQWASDQMATRYQQNAQTVEAGGVAALALVELATGHIIATADEYLEGQYGWYYLIKDDAAAERVGRFITPSYAKDPATRDRNNARKGVREVTVMVPLADCYESRRTGRIEVAVWANAKVVSA